MGAGAIFRVLSIDADWDDESSKVEVRAEIEIGGVAQVSLS